MKKTKRIEKLIKHGRNIMEVPEEFRDEFLEARRKDQRSFKNSNGEWVVIPPENHPFLG
jgi:hypothetical protein